MIALLETSGISRANPYNIVPQGKVNALVMMKDAGRLEMLKDIGGVNTYDERRTESMKMMNDTRDKQGKVSETLKYIGTRLHGLEEEKEELVQAQALDKKRKVMEYTYYDKELKKSKSELDQMEAQRSETCALGPAIPNAQVHDAPRRTPPKRAAEGTMCIPFLSRAVQVQGRRRVVEAGRGAASEHQGSGEEAEGDEGRAGTRADRLASTRGRAQESPRGGRAPRAAGEAGGSRRGAARRGA